MLVTMRRWLKRSLLFLVTILLIGGITYWRYLPPAETRDRESYAVLSSYISQKFEGNLQELQSRNFLIVLYGKTSNGQFRVLLPDRPGFGSRWMRAEQMIGSLVKSSWENRFQLPFKYKFTSDAFDESDLSESDRHLSSRTITFSRVSFNHNATQALFYTEYICGLCGEGKFVLMEKQSGKWIVLGEQYTWVS